MSNAIELDDLVVHHVQRGVVRLRPEQTVGEALLEIRRQSPPGRIIYFYVVDAEDRLQGVVPTRRLLLSDFEARISEIMISPVVSIPASATVLDACEYFILYRLLAFPVIDDQGRLLGIVDVEMYTDEIGEIERAERASRSDDLFQLIGVHVTAARTRRPWATFRSRFPWLLCNIGGGLLAAVLTGLFQEELERTVAIALFVPVTLALAEGVSIQSVSLALQLMQGRQPSLGSVAGWVAPEAVTGGMLGVASSLLVALTALLWIGNARLAVCLLGGISAGVTCAAVLGLAVPALLRTFDRDPQVAAGPVVLATSDMLSLAFYFGLARWLL